MFFFEVQTNISHENQEENRRGSEKDIKIEQGEREIVREIKVSEVRKVYLTRREFSFIKDRNVTLGNHRKKDNLMYLTKWKEAKRSGQEGIFC